jgi:hypothetical protein
MSPGMVLRMVSNSERMSLFPGLRSEQELEFQVAIEGDSLWEEMIIVCEAEGERHRWNPVLFFEFFAEEATVLGELLRV